MNNCEKCSDKEWAMYRNPFNKDELLCFDHWKPLNDKERQNAMNKLKVLELIMLSGGADAISLSKDC